jgi:hypothetical protein
MDPTVETHKRDFAFWLLKLLLWPVTDELRFFPPFLILFLDFLHPPRTPQHSLSIYPPYNPSQWQTTTHR